MTQNKKRSQLEPDVEQKKDLILNVFNSLTEKVHPHCYPSVFFERRYKKEFNLNPKADGFQQSLVEGLVLRVYDGKTLFEVATDKFEADELKSKVNEMVHLVRQRGEEPSEKVYPAPQWEQRLEDSLESDLVEQIPPQPTAETWVHFGVPIQTGLPDGDSEMMKYGKSLYQQLLSIGEGLPKDHKGQNPDYQMIRLSIEKLDMIFVDESVRMSQALHRNAGFAIVMKQGERGLSMVGGLGGHETVDFTSDQLKEAYDKLDKCLRAERIEPGRYKLLMHPSITGVFAHEAFGHSQEGDTWARERSKARELYESQEKVGNEFATIVNNPAIYRNGEEPFAAWGSYYFDEEGWLAKKHYLVVEGRLQKPMTNLTSALRLGVPRTANGKREAWTNGVYTRQTNTYFSEGEKTFNELMGMVDYGFYATTAFGGMEDPKGMGIQVGMAYLEEIKDGQFTGRIFKAPNGGAVQMTGYVPDYLNSILGKSKIEAFSDGPDESTHPWNEVGGCGKYHKEFVVAGCGGPYMLVDQVLLG